MTSSTSLVSRRGASRTSPPGGRSRRFWTGTRKDMVVGYAFVAPEVLGVAIFVLAPVGLAIWYSLNEWNIFAGEMTFVGGANYVAMLNDPNIPAVLGATGIFSVGLVVLNMSVGLGLAVLLNQKLRGITVFRTIFFSPVVVSVVAWALISSLMLQDNGVINGALSTVGIDGPNWLQSGPTAMIGIIVSQVLRSVGINMVLFLAALQGVPQELYEAARLDGAGRARIFWRITVPLISPTLLLTSILTIIGALQSFAMIAVLTEGGPGTSTTVLVYYVFQQAFSFSKIGYGATLALMLLMFVLVLTLVQWQMRRRFVFYEN
ncbi:carbohydrate ABC transporter permease [Microbacterium sp. A588]